MVKKKFDLFLARKENNFRQHDVKSCDSLLQKKKKKSRQLLMCEADQQRAADSRSLTWRKTDKFNLTKLFLVN